MEKAVPDPFPKIKIEHTSDQQLETLYSLFFLYVQVEGYQDMLKLTCWYLALTSWKFFWEIVVWSWPLSLMFCMFFKEKYCSRYILLTDQILLLLLLETLADICIVTNCLQVDDVVNFEINLCLLSKPFSFVTKKVRTYI